MISRSILLFPALAALVLLAACASAPQGTASQTASASTSAAATTDIVDDFDGDGMELPLDGTSLAAFDASMERVRRHSDPALYSDLENAVDYLLVYDLSVRGDKAKLVQKLDSMTGYEVIELVNNRIKGRGSKGRSSLET